MANPWEKYGAAPAGPVTLGSPDPTAPLDVTLKGQQIAKGSRDAGLDARLAPLKVKQAELAIRNAELATEKVERELKGGGAKGDAKTASLNALVAQINRVQELYEKNIAPTSGMAGLLDLLPTDANKQFNTAGAGLAEQGLAAFRVPGVGSQSDTELRQFVEANRPDTFDRDLEIEEKLRQLRNRVEATRDSMGLPPPAWAFNGQTVAPDRQDQGVPGVAPGASGGGLDVTEQRIAPPTGGDAISLAQGGSSVASNPALAGVNARVNKMLQDRASDADIAGYLRGVGVDPSSDPKLATSLARAFEFRRKNPGYRGSYSVDLEGQVNIPLSGTQQFMNSTGQSPLGSHAISSLDMMTLGNLDSLTANPEVTRALMSSVQEQNPKAAFSGSLLGGALMAGGAELGAGLGLARLGAGAGRFAPAAGDLIFGAGYGAGSNDGDRLGGALSGALAGAGGGMFGRSVTRGTGRALTGARDASTRYLADRGVPLTLGQIAGQGGVVGRTIRGLEDKLESAPLIGDAIRSRRLEGVRAFNQQAMGQALEPIGANVAGEVGEEGIEGARGAVSQAYRDALSGVSVQPDAPFVTDMQTALARGQGLPGNMADEFAYTVRNRVAPEFDNGALTGEGYQAIRQGLRRDRRAMQSQPRGHDFGDAVRGVEGAAESLVRRGAPEVVPALNSADSAFGRLKVVEDAVGRGVNTEGLFTPAQLGLAARANAKRFGGNQATTQRPFFDLQRAGQEVLPSQVPNSGTTDRAIAAALVPAAIGGAGYGLDIIGPEEAAVLASFGLPYTAAGRAALQRGLIARPGPVRALGEGVIRRSRVGGMLGAGAAAPLALGYSGQ